ncbi:MAG: PDZ domain-containing protein [Ignavibacteriae bacterium]|nr:PDZ domain-containing protein [Ignavibacteriota bacterium]
MRFTLSKFIVVAIFLTAPTVYSCDQLHTKTVTVKKFKNQGWLGVSIQDVTKRLKERENLKVDHGVYVTDVVEDSPAEKAGIQEGDIIISFDGKTIDDSDDLTKAVRRMKPKTNVKVEVQRGGEKKMLTAVVDRVPRSYSYSFGFDDDVHIPPLPRAPLRMHLFEFNELQGIQVQKLNKQLAEYFEVPGGKGLLVTEVKKSSEAEKAGFKVGDVIVNVNGSVVRDFDDLHEELRESEKENVPFDIIRKGKPMTLTMKVDNWNDGEDDDKDDEEEDEEDLSYFFFTPRDYVDRELLELDLQRTHREGISQLKENLLRWKDKLRSDMERLKDKLKDDLERLKYDVKFRLIRM